MKGNLVVIEGTDCSGKETQMKLLVKKLTDDGYKVGMMSFPNYNSPTGKIIGSCLLGKKDLCNQLLKSPQGLFPEGGANIDEIVACDLYVADRRYNLPTLLDLLNNNDIVILDRYVTSNMAHRGGLKNSREERIKIYNKIEILEYELNELPRPDKTYLLYLPTEYTNILKNKRVEELDDVELNEYYLKKGEKAYLELAELYNFEIIDCTKKGKIRSIEDINCELYNKVKKEFFNNN